MRTLRYIAFFTIAGGMLLLSRISAAVSGEFADGFRLPLLTIAILASALGITLTIISVAILHLKQHSRRSAMRLAVAAPIVAFFVWSAFSAQRDGGVVAALLLYFIVIRPTLSSTFRDHRKNA